MISFRWNLSRAAMILPSLFLGLATSQSAQCATPNDEDAVHIVEGVVTRVDHAGKEIGIKTADGVEKTFKTTGRTVVHAGGDVEGATKDAVIDTARGLDKGTHVMVHYTEAGATDTATKVERFDRGALKDTKATVVDVDHDARTVLVKTDKGATETYHVADDASVDVGKGVKDFAGDAGRDIEKGSRVTLHFSEKAGKKTIHFIEKL